VRLLLWFFILWIAAYEGYRMAPPALLGVRPGQPVEVVVSKKTDEDYVAPRSAWGGSGVRLGAPVPGLTSTPTASGSGSSSAPTPMATSQIKAPTVDEGQPVAQVQVRLADGGRCVLSFSFPLYPIFVSFLSLSADPSAISPTFD
jgi:hypothetical protein